MPLPAYYLKVILTSGLPCMAAMMMNGGRLLQMLFEPFSKSPGGSPYVSIITGKVTTLVPAYGLTFADHVVFVLGETSGFLMVLPPLKWVCMPYLPQIFLILSQETFCVRYNNMTLCFYFIGGGLVVSPISNLPGGPV